MRRIALSALISLRQARSLSIVQRGAHHAVVRGVLDRSDVDAIRRQAGQSVAVSTDGRSSHVNCFDLHKLPDVLKRLQEAIGVVTEDRSWPPLAEDFQMCDAQHCVYSTGGHFDWHLDDESDGAQGFRRLSAVVLMSDSGEFEGGAFCVDRSEASALPLANCGDAARRRRRRAPQNGAGRPSSPRLGRQKRQFACPLSPTSEDCCRPWSASLTRTRCRQ